MSWVCVDLDQTLLDDSGRPLVGAREAMHELLRLGHRVSILTSRFHGADLGHIPVIKQHVENALHEHQLPFSDVWTGHVKPSADAFIDNRNVAFRGSWPQALAQTLMMIQLPHGEESVIDEVTDEGGEAE